MPQIGSVSESPIHKPNFSYFPREKEKKDTFKKIYEEATNQKKMMWSKRPIR